MGLQDVSFFLRSFFIKDLVLNIMYHFLNILVSTRTILIGENVLHIAIVNEDPSMVKFLLDSGVNFQERCFGNFMCPEDQKSSRTDSLDHEWVNVSPITNYEGYVYWGEYPLTFAACLGQEECYRLMLSRGADPDAQDTNGNTVLHLLVIYQKLAST